LKPSGAWWVDAAAIASLSAFCALLLRKTLLGGGALVGFDLFNYFYPAKTYFAAALRRGELPLWNPFTFFGAPFLANVQMGVLYPPDLIFALADFPTAAAVSQWLHLTIGAAGMYALARWGWGTDAVGALVGGLAFGGSGFLGAHMGHLNQVHAAVWLPWIALCAFRLAALAGTLRTRRGASRGLAWLVAGGCAVALQLTAGHTQEAYYSLFAVGLLALAFTALPPARARYRRSHLPALAAITANGALLAAAQLVPSLELQRQSYRSAGVPLEEAVSFGVDRTLLLESLLPTFWSLPSQEVTGYVGMVALPLAVAGVAASRARRLTVALLGLALLAIVLSLGSYTPLYYVLHRWVPLFDSFRAPGRWLLVSTFALAGLAALGTTALRRQPESAARERTAFRVAVALAAVVALIAVAMWRTQAVHALQWLPAPRVAVLWALAALGSTTLGLAALFSRTSWPRLALAAALALELGLAAREMEYNRPGSPTLYSEWPAITAQFEAADADRAPVSGPPQERVLSLAVEERLDSARLLSAVPRSDGIVGGDGEYRRYAAMREVLRPNLGQVYALPTIDGYDGGLLPTRDYAAFKELLVKGESAVAHFTLAPQLSGSASASLMGALNVRYLLLDGRHGEPGPGWTPLAAAPGAAWLYENDSTLPRAYVVTRATRASDHAEALRTLAVVNPRTTAVVEGPLPEGLRPDAGHGPGRESPAAVRPARIVRYSAETVEIDAISDGAALLVVTDSFYPGWRATVDGRAEPIVRANGLFRGVWLTGGEHRVRLWFEPLSVKLGFAISAVAVVANGLAMWRCLLDWRRRER
jgi:hypothetical protein